jgi:integrase/recombinase XerC
MSNLPARQAPRDGAIRTTVLPKVGPADMYEALLVDSSCANTRRSRVDVVKVLCLFLGEEDPRAACAALITGGKSQANAIASSFRQHMIRSKNANATVNNRLAALRRLIELANRHDLIDWRLTVDDMRVTPYRDTRGPTPSQWKRLWAAAVTAEGSFAVRNRAIVRLLRDGALRKSEVIGLDMDDLDLEGERVTIVGKGHGTETVWVTISPKCIELLRDYLAIRGTAPGPVFVSKPSYLARDEIMQRIRKLNASGMTHAKIAELFQAEGRVTPTGRPWDAKRIQEAGSEANKRRKFVRRLCDREVGRIIYDLAEAAGLGRTIRPHSLRHHAITRVLDLTNGNIRMAQKLARHRNANTTMIYDDNRQDLAGDCARLLGEDD